MKKTAVLLALALVVCVHATLQAQGTLTPPGAPAPTQKSLQEIWDRTEQRTAITTLPYEITEGGSYYLPKNPAYSGSGGITIGASGVTLDLNGFALAGSSQAGPAITTNGSVSQVVVKNGQILEWQSHGIDLSAALNSRVENISVRAVGGRGIHTGFYSSVNDCRVEETGDRGIVVGGDSQIQNCIVARSQGHGVSLGEGSSADALVVYQSLGTGSVGIWLENGATVSNSKVNSPSARGIVTSACGTVRDCGVNNSGGVGVSLGEESLGENLVVNTTLSDSQGILMGNDSTLRSARVHNSSGSGIEGANRGTVIDCVVESPGGAGVYMGGNAVVSDTRVANAASYGYRLHDHGTVKNSTATSGVSAGFYLFDHFMVENCTSTSNIGDGFSVGSFGVVAKSSAVKNRTSASILAAGVNLRGQGNSVSECNFVNNERAYRLPSVSYGNLLSRCSAVLAQPGDDLISGGFDGRNNWLLHGYLEYNNVQPGYAYHHDNVNTYSVGYSN